MEDISVGYALPQMPNTIAIGDLMAGRPGKPLPRDLEDFMSASKDGVILMSFGTGFDVAAHDVVRKFCDAFTDRRNRLLVVWKMKDDDDACSSDRRVKLMPWVPQNDLLADSRVQIFISNGGFNSIIESAYHAKPMIIFPIMFDQMYNAAAAESKGLSAWTSVTSVRRRCCPTSRSYFAIRPTVVPRTCRQPSCVIDPTRRHSACPP